jgi:glycosyltransferase involved in cell wall biosynthesis
MRVLQVVPGLSPNFGGPSVALTDMSRLLCERGVETLMIATNEDSQGRLDVPLGVPINYRGAQVLYCNVWPRTRYAFSASLARELRRLAPTFDVLHIHWLYNFSPLAAAWAAQRAGVPYLVTPAGSLDPNLMRKNRWLKAIYMRTLGGYITGRAAGIIYTTEAERRLANLPNRKVPTHVIPVGLDGRQYEALPVRGGFRARFPELVDKKVVMFLSRLHPQKGLDLLIQAFKEIGRRHERAHLLIVGADGNDYARQVKVWVQEAGLSSRVTFSGRVADELKVSAYVDCDIFVLPSRAENFGAVVTEAMACGCPVVISDRVNLCGEVAAADAGVVVPCSVEGVVAGLDRVLRDENLARRISANGQRLVRRRFTWEVAFEQLIPLYRQLAESGHNRRARSSSLVETGTIAPTR